MLGTALRPDSHLLVLNILSFHWHHRDVKSHPLKGSQVILSDVGLRSFFPCMTACSYYQTAKLTLNDLETGVKLEKALGVPCE